MDNDVSNDDDNITIMSGEQSASNNVAEYIQIKSFNQRNLFITVSYFFIMTILMICFVMSIRSELFKKNSIISHKNINTQIITFLKKLRSDYECGYVSSAQYSIYSINEMFNTDITLHTYKFSSKIFVDFDKYTLEYVGNERSYKFMCKLTQHYYTLKSYVPYVFISVVSITVIAFIIYAIYKYKQIMNSYTDEMFKHILLLLESNSENYIAACHYYHEFVINSSWIKRRVWNKVYNKVNKDPRIRTTPITVAGDNVVGWKWISTISKK